jgi:hypothetical protein
MTCRIPKNPSGNSGTTEPSAGPVVPRFPPPPDSRGNKTRKHGNRAGIIGRSPAGMGEVIFSNVTGADLSQIHAIPHCRDPGENHPVKSRPYSRSGSGDTRETSCRTLLTEPVHVPYRSFHVGDLCSPFVSDTGLPGFSDGETILCEGMSQVRGWGLAEWRLEKKDPF